MYTPGFSPIWVIQKQIEMSSSLWLPGDIEIYQLLLNFHHTALFRDKRSINSCSPSSEKHGSHETLLRELFNQRSPGTWGKRRPRGDQALPFINSAYSMRKGRLEDLIDNHSSMPFRKKEEVTSWFEWTALEKNLAFFLCGISHLSTKSHHPSYSRTNIKERDFFIITYNCSLGTFTRRAGQLLFPSPDKRKEKYQ